MSRLLITGVHGFVGSNLVAALKGDNTIYGLDIVAPEKDGVKKTYSWEDLENNTIPPVDAIIHLAGKAHDLKNKSASDIYFKINTDLTKKIFNYFTANRDIHKFIFFSSVKAAVDKVPDDILTEDVTPCPVGPYGESKVRAEEYILDRLKEAPQLYGDRDVIILRPCMIHGSGNKGNLNLLYGVISKGIPWPLGAFENKRTFTSIDNLSFVIEKLLSMKVESGIYNMADDEALSTNELIDVMCKAMGKKSHIWNLPKGMIRFGARIGDVLHLPLNTFRLDKLTENYIVSNEKIKRALNIESMPVNARDGLTETIRSFQNQ
ncbi:MAG: NAD-dependent epimerase/dehydratase family protein [Duncaniella sp.]|uniref:NAD-dependent epimerase/dehydratase family protein n=1 Tax=Duncaniella sp. TaxID=2518496 RepID=UPI0023D04F0E|nr:NAD-dependent epimerase/dehydratase family protein [Duncaniella sp.]MDE6091218.1 NAD-dependent epimerase/dehydratase family protein [Duncaniella sp.]